MNTEQFILVGENIHCTRSVKRGGKRTTSLEGAQEGVTFTYNGESRVLPIPPEWGQISPPYTEGKIRHIALGMYMAHDGKTEEQRKAGAAYLCWAAERQIERGAAFLDVNVDEYSYDPTVRTDMMKWVVTFLSQRYDTPLSIDSSNVETLTAGLECCRQETAPMVNSVSLEREEAVDTVMQYKAHAIVSAAGRKGLPSSVEERVANFTEIIAILDKAGMEHEKMHLDSLVLPISVDPMNGKNFLDAAAQAKDTFSGVNFSGGLSNVSFGMPKRKLLNLTFARMFVEIGGNGGIIDPVQMNAEDIAAVDTESEAFHLARAVLDGTDMYGSKYIKAYRKGKLL